MYLANKWSDFADPFTEHTCDTTLCVVSVCWHRLLELLELARIILLRLFWMLNHPSVYTCLFSICIFPQYFCLV